MEGLCCITFTVLWWFYDWCDTMKMKLKVFYLYERWLFFGIEYEVVSMDLGAAHGAILTDLAKQHRLSRLQMVFKCIEKGLLLYKAAKDPHSQLILQKKHADGSITETEVVL